MTKAHCWWSRSGWSPSQHLLQSLLRGLNSGHSRSLPARAGLMAAAEVPWRPQGINFLTRHPCCRVDQQTLEQPFQKCKFWRLFWCLYMLITGGIDNTAPEQPMIITGAKPLPLLTTALIHDGVFVMCYNSRFFNVQVSSHYLLNLLVQLRLLLNIIFNHTTYNLQHQQGLCS